MYNASCPGPSILDVRKPSPQLMQVSVRYIRIIAHVFPRAKFRKMYRIRPGFPPQLSLPSSQEKIRGTGGASVSPGGDSRDNREHPVLSLLHTVDSAAACWALGKICARDQRYPQDISHWHGRERFSIQVAITFHPCGPGDPARPELLLGREEMLWARGRAGLQTTVGRGRDGLVFLHLLLCSFSPQ